MVMGKEIKLGVVKRLKRGNETSSEQVQEEIPSELDREETPSELNQEDSMEPLDLREPPRQ
jgi:DNA-directed RNA polymerase specialized sigma subunit